MLKKSIKLFDEFGGDRESGAYTLQEMTCRNCADWLKSLKDKVQPKQEWSVEDMIHLSNAIIAAEGEWGPESATAAWLASLENRIQLQKWSEEDENYINDLVSFFSQNEKLKNTKEDIVNWLKSLHS